MKLALVFPGQGSQAVGMMQGFADNRIVRDTFAEATAVLGQDLWQLVADGPAGELNATVNTQPVMLTAGYAMYRAWLEAGGKPRGREFIVQDCGIGPVRIRREGSRLEVAEERVGRFRACPISGQPMPAIASLDPHAHHRPPLRLAAIMAGREGGLLDHQAALADTSVHSRLTDIGLLVRRWSQCSAGKS